MSKPANVDREETIVAEGGFDDIDGIIFGVGIPDINADLLGERFELADGGGSVHVCGDEIRSALLLFEHIGHFAAGGGFSRTLEADDHDRDGGFVSEIEGSFFFGTKQTDHLVVDDLDELLARSQGFHHLGTNGAFADILDELLNHFEIDIRLEQAHPHIFERVLDVLFVEFALPTQFAKGVLKFAC